MYKEEGSQMLKLTINSLESSNVTIGVLSASKGESFTLTILFNVTTLPVAVLTSTYPERLTCPGPRLKRRFREGKGLSPTF